MKSKQTERNKIQNEAINESTPLKNACNTIVSFSAQRKEIKF